MGMLSTSNMENTQPTQAYESSSHNAVTHDDSIESNWDKSVQKYEELNLKKDLLRGIFGYGFNKPSFIQQKGILPILKGKDVIAQAQSGSGKTGTFVIGALELVEPQSDNLQVLILSPTRELAKQIDDNVKAIGNYLGVKSHIFKGGTPVAFDRKMLRDGIQVAIGTPGRINDLMQRDALQTQHLKLVILDEADDLLGKGFLEQINEILKNIPPETQLALFSATMPPEVIKMCENIMNNPARILVKNQDLTLEGIKQFYISCSNDDIKFQNLIEIFSHLDVTQCIIYCNKIEKAQFIQQEMQKLKFVVGCMHSKMEQEERDRVMEEFRSGSSRLLVTTDLLARGIDIYQVGLIINFDLPTRKENYIHRIGRSGRYGRRGLAINLITKQEGQMIITLEEFYSTHIDNLPNDLSEL